MKKEKKPSEWRREATKASGGLLINIKLKPWEINECYFTLYNILCLLKVTQSRGEKNVEMLTFLLYTAIIYFSKSYSITWLNP